MATYAQEKEFIEELIPRGMLDLAIEWIKKNLDPEDVFSTKQLDAWAESEGYIKQSEQ